MRTFDMRTTLLTSLTALFISFFLSLSFISCGNYDDDDDDATTPVMTPIDDSGDYPQVKIDCAKVGDSEVLINFAGKINAGTNFTIGKEEQFGGYALCIDSKELNTLYSSPVVLTGPAAIFLDAGNLLVKIFFAMDSEPLLISEENFDGVVTELGGVRYAEICEYRAGETADLNLTLPGLKIFSLSVSKVNTSVLTEGQEIKAEIPLSIKAGVRVEPEEVSGNSDSSIESIESVVEESTGGEGVSTDETDEEESSGMVIKIYGEVDISLCPQEVRTGSFSLRGFCDYYDDILADFLPQFSGAYELYLPIDIGICEVNAAVVVEKESGDYDYFYAFPEGRSNQIKLWKTDINLNFIFCQPTEIEDADSDGVADSADNCPNISNPDQADSDGDSLGNTCDNCPAVKNSDQTDADSDGVGDACEVVQDTDGDSVTDSADNCPNGANSDQGDQDKDGVGDICDNCPEVANKDQADADKDFKGDLCDNCPLIFVAQKDEDQDGVGDGCDNCPEVANKDQADQDSDEVGNVCDNCPNISNPDQADTDGDSLGNTCDNCPEIKNLDQKNYDKDGVGDKCDNCPDKENTDQTDQDSDEVGNVCDNCPDKANPEQLEGDCSVKDTDGDAIPDSLDNCQTIINTNQTDQDSDKVGDACDNCQQIANTDQADGDGDKIGNACDNCKNTTNADQEDTDGDKIGDVCDNCPDIYNPDQSSCTKDTDKDGVPDSADNCSTTANQDQKDTDGDNRGDRCDNCPFVKNYDQDPNACIVQGTLYIQVCVPEEYKGTVTEIDIQSHELYGATEWGTVQRYATCAFDYGVGCMDCMGKEEPGTYLWNGYFKSAGRTYWFYDNYPSGKSIGKVKVFYGDIAIPVIPVGNGLGGYSGEITLPVPK